jgi:hypothetical protein
MHSHLPCTSPHLDILPAHLGTLAAMLVPTTRPSHCHVLPDCLSTLAAHSNSHSHLPHAPPTMVLSPSTLAPDRVCCGTLHCPTCGAAPPSQGSATGARIASLASCVDVLRFVAAVSHLTTFYYSYSIHFCYNCIYILLTYNYSYLVICLLILPKKKNMYGNNIPYLEGGGSFKPRKKKKFDL